MDQTMTRPIPAHVPPDLVRDVDILLVEVGDDPQAALARELAPLPDTFYMPKSARFPDFGSWVFRREADIRAIMQDTDNFTCHGIAGFDILAGSEDSWRALPSEADPPEHGKFRGLLNPLFSPSRIRSYEDNLRRHVIGVIDRHAAAGGGEFMDIARSFPVGMFSQFLDISAEETRHVLDQVRLILHSGYDAAKRRRGINGLIAIEEDLVRRRRANPGEDLVSLILAAEIDGRKLTDKEMLGMFVFFLLAGIDTTASATGFIFHHLARHPQDRTSLAADPSRIPDAIEESLRRYSQITTNRFVKHEVEVGGVELKAGDHVFCSMILANLDPEANPDPLATDLSRSPNRHMAFGAGPHRCLGSNIARLQLKITLEEWFARLPDFWVPEGAQVRAVNSEAMILETLPLRWEAPQVTTG